MGQLFVGKQLQEAADRESGIQLKADTGIIQIIGKLLTQDADPVVDGIAVAVQLPGNSLDGAIALQIFFQGGKVVTLVFFFICFCRCQQGIGIRTQYLPVRYGQKDLVKAKLVKGGAAFFI